MDQPSTVPRHRFGEQPRCLLVDERRRSFVRLGGVHGGVGRGVDDDVGPVRRRSLSSTAPASVTSRSCAGEGDDARRRLAATTRWWPSCPPAPVINQVTAWPRHSAPRRRPCALPTKARFVGIPLDRLRQAGAQVGVLRRPAEFVAQFRRVDGVTQVVAGPIGRRGRTSRPACPSARGWSRSTSRLLRSPSAPMRYVSPLRPASMIVQTALLWSSTWIQSRTFAPAPYSRGRRSTSTLVI